MSTCGICGKGVRKTNLVALLYGGAITNKRACTECVRRGVLVTTMPHVRAEKPAVLDAEERDVREVLRKLARHLRGMSTAQKRMDAVLTAEGLDQAADIADAWASRPEARR